MAPIFRKRKRTPAIPISLVEGYELWAQTYEEEASRPLSRIEMSIMRELMPEVGDESYGDLACGTGRYTELLLARGANRVHALDRSERMLSLLKCKGLAANLVRADLDALPLATGSLQGAVCGLALGHLADIGPFLSEAMRAIAPGGWLLFSDFHPRAAEAGLIRTFEAGGKNYVLPHHPRTVEEFERELANVAARIEGIKEASAADEPEAFAGTGRMKNRDRDLPLVLAILARRS